MKIKIALLLGLVMAVIAGCVPSWNPLYTDNDLVSDAQLVGAWRPAEAKDTSKETWSFSKVEDKLYRLTHTDEEGFKAEFDVRVVQLQTNRFLDLYLHKVEGEVKLNAWAGFSLIPGHLVFKLEQVEPALRIAAMNPDWLKDHVKKHPNAIAHRVTADGSIILAASTVDLQKFVLAHAAGENLFGGPMELKRLPENASAR